MGDSKRQDDLACLLKQINSNGGDISVALELPYCQIAYTVNSDDYEIIDCTVVGIGKYESIFRFNMKDVVVKKISDIEYLITDKNTDSVISLCFIE